MLKRNNDIVPTGEWLNGNHKKEADQQKFSVSAHSVECRAKIELNHINTMKRLTWREPLDEEYSRFQREPNSEKLDSGRDSGTS